MAILTKFIFILFIVFPSWTLAFGSDPHIILNKKLSPFWAKEYAGLDLVKDLIEQDRIGRFSDRENISFAVFDLGFEKDHISLSEGFLDLIVPPQMNGRRTMRANHGTSVLNLLTGPETIRATDVGTLVGLGGIAHAFQYKYYLQEMEKRGVNPKVISNSLGWNSESIPDLVKSASEKGTLWFLAAGNSFPEPVSELEKNSEAMLVGSFAYNGLTSYEAQIDPKMVVLAPANKELLTIDGQGKIYNFGASSGATPLVSATAINISFYLPNLKRAQMVKILKSTSWPSVENKLGHGDLPGLLNSFKAVLVARNIALKCEDNGECIDKEIHSEEAYEVVQLDTEWNEKEKQLRALSLIGNVESTRELIHYYRSIGLEWNAEYFIFLGEKTFITEKAERWTRQAMDEGLFEFNSYRYFPLYSETLKNTLKESTMVKEYHKDMYLKLTKENLRGL